MENGKELSNTIKYGCLSISVIGFIGVFLVISGYLHLNSVTGPILFLLCVALLFIPFLILIILNRK